MIVLDSSALVAILFDEPERQAFQEVIAGGERCISRPSMHMRRQAYCVYAMVWAPLNGFGSCWQTMKLRSSLSMKYRYVLRLPRSTARGRASTRRRGSIFQTVQPMR